MTFMSVGRYASLSKDWFPTGTLTLCRGPFIIQVCHQREGKVISQLLIFADGEGG